MLDVLRRAFGAVGVTFSGMTLKVIHGPGWFWQINAGSRGRAPTFSAQVLQLEKLLRELPLAERQWFQGFFAEFMDKADRRSLKRMASELGGPAGDDGFMDFRSWLISRGRKTLFAALRDPESLRLIAAESEDVSFDEFQPVAGSIIDEGK